MLACVKHLHCSMGLGHSSIKDKDDDAAHSKVHWAQWTHGFYHLVKSYLDSAACLSMRALRSSFSCWTFLRFSSNFPFFSIWVKKKLHDWQIQVFFFGNNHFHVPQVLPVCLSPSASSPADAAACFWYPAPLWGSLAPAAGTGCGSPSAGTNK